MGEEKKIGIAVDLLDALNSLIRHDNKNYPDHCGLLITMDKWQEIRRGCIKKEVKPNPGSDEALEQGCMCAVLDNRYGKGAFDGPDGTFWITGDCPLHGHDIGGSDEKVRI